MSEEILLISDMHVMSNWGLVHPEFVCYDKRGAVRFDLNEMQRWSFNYWVDMVERKINNISAAVFVGDIVDGINKYNYGAVATDDVYQQIKMARLFIDMLPYDIPLYFVGGTGFHSRDGSIMAEQVLADMLLADYAQEAIIEECGIRIFANHFIPHAQFKAASLEKKLSQLAAASSCYGKVDVLVGAHNHRFSSVLTSTHVAVMTPGWQHKTPYAIEKNLIIPPDIGYVKLIIEDESLITVDKRGVVESPFGCTVLGRG